MVNNLEKARQTKGIDSDLSKANALISIAESLKEINNHLDFMEKKWPD